MVQTYIEGEEVDSNVGKDPLDYVQGENHIVPGLEKEIEGMKVGEEKSVQVQPEEGYGVINPDAFLEVPKANVPEAGHEVGTTLGMQGPDGQIHHPIVSEIKEESIILDFNHPLAGKVLDFEVKVVEIA